MIGMSGKSTPPTAAGVVRKEALGRGVELEALDAELAHQPPRLLGASVALRRIDAGERNHDIAVLVGDARDLLVRVAAIAGQAFAVHRKDDPADPGPPGGG